jgi:hypothetical protein
VEVEDVDNSLVALFRLNIIDELKTIEANIEKNESKMKSLQEKSKETSVPVDDLIKREAIWLFKNRISKN